MIKYEPSKLIKQIAPRAKIKRLLKKTLTVKKAALSFVDEVDFLDKKAVLRVALKTVKGYKARVAEDPSLKADLLADPAQLIQRVQNEVLLQISSEIKTKYEGEFYIWLPSDSEEPRPEHQLNYGQKFQVGDGEMPGEEFGCKCGMQILVAEDQLSL